MSAKPSNGLASISTASSTRKAVSSAFTRKILSFYPVYVSFPGLWFLGTSRHRFRPNWDLTATKWTAEASRCLDYVIIAGDSPLKSWPLRRYHRACPAKCRMAEGFWHVNSAIKLRMKLLSVAREYKKRGLPLSIIVTDFFIGRSGRLEIRPPPCWPWTTGFNCVHGDVSRAVNFT